MSEYVFGYLLAVFMDQRIRQETHLPVQLVEDPSSSVVVGAGKILSQDALLRKLSIH